MTFTPPPHRLLVKALLRPLFFESQKIPFYVSIFEL
jgi:hypothetical protein